MTKRDIFNAFMNEKYMCVKSPYKINSLDECQFSSAN